MWPRPAPFAMNKLTVPVSRPRNPLVAAARRRKAGAHRRSKAALRRQAEQALRRELQHDPAARD